MTFWYAYVAVVVPLVIVMVIAVWRPRFWQWTSLLIGPLITALATAEVPGIRQIGWPATVGVVYAFLLVPPLLPWRRRWARWAIPAIVLLTCGFLTAVAQFEVSILFFLGFPALLSLGVLVVLLVLTLLHRRDGAPVSSHDFE